MTIKKVDIKESNIEFSFGDKMSLRQQKNTQKMCVFN